MQVERNEFVLKGVRPNDIAKELDEVLKCTDRKVVRIKSWCKNCGICVMICPKHAIDFDPKTKNVELVRPDDCTKCGMCEKICPDFAIMVTGVERKQIK